MTNRKEVEEGWMMEIRGESLIPRFLPWRKIRLDASYSVCDCKQGGMQAGRQAVIKRKMMLDE